MSFRYSSTRSDIFLEQQMFPLPPSNRTRNVWHMLNVQIDMEPICAGSHAFLWLTTYTSRYIFVYELKCRMNAFICRLFVFSATDNTRV